MRNRRKAQSGFTLIEALVTIVLVGIGVVGAFGGMRAIGQAQARADTADLLQRLAVDELNQLSEVTDPSTAATSGDFSSEGHPEISWKLDVQQANAQNLDQVTVTATRNNESQAVSSMIYVAPTTTTGSTGSGATGA